ncbi:MAG: P-loop NTPase [Candidatus Aenigmatarchaeota archaeon]
MGVFSAKGGVGKTTLTANLGASLVSEFNKTVCLIDGNVTAANLGLYYGLYYSPVTLYDVLNSRTPINTAIYIHPSGVRILPSPISVNKLDISVKGLSKHLCKLEGYDHIIVDSPPSLTRQTIECLNLVEQALLVATPDAPAVTDAAKMAIHAEKNGVEILGLVINRVRNRSYELTIDEIQSIAGIDVIGMIPEHENVQRSLADGKPEVLKNPYSDFSTEVNKIASAVFGLEYNPPSVLDKIKFWVGMGHSQGSRTEDFEKQKSKKAFVPKRVYRIPIRPEAKTKRYESDSTTEDTYGMEDQLKTEIMGMLRDSIREKLRESTRRNDK